MEKWVAILPAQSVWVGLGILAALGLIIGLSGRAGVSRLEGLGVFCAGVLAGGVLSRVFWVLMEPGIGWAALGEQFWQLADPRRGGYSSFGAMAGGALVLLGWWVGAARKSGGSALELQRRGRAFDIIILAGLCVLALARMGCLADGCDFGRVSEAGWAVRHGVGSEALSAHVAQGLVGWGARWSLPVHPFGLYMAAGTGLIAALGALGVWHRWLRPGRVGLLSAGGYFIWRFLVEFSRDLSSAPLWRDYLNTHQHLAIVFALSCVAVWAMLRRHN